MEMKDGLSRIGVCVHHEPISRFGDALTPRQLGSELRHLADELGILHRARGWDVLAWNHEDVHGCLGIDVPERHALIGLGDERRWDLLASNSAEEARVRHCSSVRALRARHECAQYAGGDHAGRLEA